MVTSRAEGFGLASGQVLTEAGANTVVHEGIKPDKMPGESPSITD
jgi:hypothetical protein